MARPPLQRIALAGLGAVGLPIARALDAASIPGFRLSAVAVRDVRKAQAKLSAFQQPPLVLDALDALEPHADVVVECAPAGVLPAVVRPFLERGKTAVVVSCGALLEHQELVELAREKGAQIVVPSGALLGLDAVTAAAAAAGDGEGIRAVRMVTRKPPGGLAGAPYLEQHKISLEGIMEPTKVFEGTPREAAKGFPANLNVAVAVSLAGIGPDRTVLEIWADPTVQRNVHRVEVEAEAARFTMEIENVPSEANPRTAMITALSVIAYLRKIHAPLRVGS